MYTAGGDGVRGPHLVPGPFPAPSPTVVRHSGGSLIVSPGQGRLNTSHPPAWATLSRCLCSIFLDYNKCWDGTQESWLQSPNHLRQARRKHTHPATVFFPFLPLLQWAGAALLPSLGLQCLTGLDQSQPSRVGRGELQQTLMWEPPGVPLGMWASALLGCSPSRHLYQVHSCTAPEPMDQVPEGS